MIIQYLKTLFCKHQYKTYNTPFEDVEKGKSLISICEKCGKQKIKFI